MLKSTNLFRKSSVVSLGYSLLLCEFHKGLTYLNYWIRKCLVIEIFTGLERAFVVRRN